MADGLVPVDALVRMSGAQIKDAFSYDKNGYPILS